MNLDSSSRMCLLRTLSFLMLPLLVMTAARGADRKTETLKFTLPDVCGREVRSSDYVGVPVLIEYGACWCGGCQQEAAELGSLARRYADKGLHVIRSISGDNELASLEFQKHYRLPIVHLLDANRTFEKQYNRDGWPFMLLADSLGTVVHATNETAEELPKITAEIDKMLAAGPTADAILRDGVRYMPATLKRSGEEQTPRPRDRFPSLASGPNGRVYVAFSRDRDGQSDVFLRAFDGTSWGKDQPVAATPADEFDGSVLVEPGGRIWLSWTSNTNGKNYNVFVASSTDLSQPLKPAQVTFADDDAFHARMACDRGGKVWITYYRWLKRDSLSRDREVYARRWEGAKWSDEIQVSPTDVPWYEDHSDPAIASYDDGVVVCWSWDYHKPKGYTQDAENPTVFLRSIGTDLKLGPAAYASGKSTDVTPAVAVDGRNRVWCAWDAMDWNDRARANRKGVRVCRRDLTAGRPFPPQSLGTPVVNVCTPAMAASPDGSLALVWGENVSGQRWVVKSARFDPKKNEWSKPTSIRSEGNPRFPSLACDAKGRFWIAYSAETANGRQITAEPLRSGSE